MHVNNAANFVLQQQGNLEKQVRENIKQVWDNQEEIKGGMDAAEFNLRAHQKVLNALAMEFEALVTHLNDEIFKTEHEMHVLELADVTLPSDAGEESQVVRRLDWPYYHEQVEDDLKIIKKIEEQKDSEKKSALELENQMKRLSETSAELVKAAEEAGNDPVEVRAEYASMMALTQRVSVALGQKLRGEEYDQAALDEAQRLIASVELLDASLIEDAPQPQDDLPEGASVFGG